MGLSLEQEGNQWHEASGVTPARPSPTGGGLATLQASVLPPSDPGPALHCGPTAPGKADTGYGQLRSLAGVHTGLGLAPSGKPHGAAAHCDH